MADLDPRDEWYDKKKLNKIFAWSSAALLVATAWMIYDDWDREWKHYQRQFQEVQAERFAIEADEVWRENADTYARAYYAYRAARESAAARKAEVRRIEAKIAKLDAEIYVADNAEKEARNLAAVEKSRYEAGEAEALARYREQIARASEYRAELERLRANRKALSAELVEAHAGLDAAEDEVEAALRGWRQVQEALRSARWTWLDYLRNAPLLDFMDPSVKIRQVVPEKLTRDMNFGFAQRVDRCQTCHLGIDDARFALTEDGTAFADPKTQTAIERVAARAGADSAVVYRRYLKMFSAHPRLDVYVASNSLYPVEKYGCTICHEGNGRGTSMSGAVHVPPDEETKKRWEKEYDYEYNHYWQWPMLPGKYVEGNLQRLRKGTWEVPEPAEELNRGLALIQRYQCFACHKIERAEEVGLTAHAPTLEKIEAKLRPGWVYTWLKNPRALRPGTRMPRFFGLANAETPEDRAREDEEVKAIVRYLFARADAAGFELETPPPGEAARGKTLFHTVGCQACHVAEPGEEGGGARRDQAAGNAFGPPLTGIGSKASPAWIYAWIRDPSRYDPEARMPKLRLTEEEAADITAYLVTLTTDTPVAEDVPPHDEEVLRRLAFDLLKKQYHLAEARAIAEGKGVEELSLWVGENAIGRYGCYSCHAIEGFEGRLPIGAELSDHARKPVVRLDFGLTHDIPHTRDAWYLKKVTNPRAFDVGRILNYDERSRMPDFGISEEDGRAIVTAILGWNEEAIHPDVVRTAPPEVTETERFFTERGCRSCHVIEGRGGDVVAGMDARRAPPPLVREGARARPEWLLAFLKDPGAHPIRPNLTIRMPTFDVPEAKWAEVIHAWAARNGVPAVATDFQVDPERAARGARAFEMLGCGSCHVTGRSGAVTEAPAPPLGLAAERLRPAWTREWILHASDLYGDAREAAGQPRASIMPGYAEALPAVAADGDTQAALEDLIHYVFSLGR